jgi:Tol biopolymer transport system component
VSEAMRMKSKIEASRRERLALGFTAAGSVVLSGGVIASLIYLLLTLASLIAAPAFAQTGPVGAGVRLEAGIEKEDVDGDLKSAMDIYQKIAADTSAPRDVRAKALLRLAGCDEKLGKQAKQVYEQIVRDYSDQPPAAQARKRLALIQQQEHPALPTTMTVRKIETSGLGRIYAWTTDGERAVYLAADGNLYFGDLAGRNRRLVFKNQQGDLNVWRPSRDFSFTALGFDAKAGRPGFLALVKNDGTGYRELFRDDSQGTVLSGGTIGFDWSWDNRYLLLWTLRKVGGRVYLVSLADGQRRELARTEAGYISRAVFSPDGRFVAYEVMPAFPPPKSGTRRIFVVQTEGGGPQLVYEAGAEQPFNDETNSLKDWTVDGRYLTIQDIGSSDGKPALFLLPMKGGVVTGAPEMVRYGDFKWGLTTPSGALVYHEASTRPVGSDVFLASLDSGGHVARWQRLSLRGGRFPGGDHSASFSPSGTELAYLAPSTDVGKTDLVLREASTEQERVLYQLSGGNINCQYASSFSTILCASSKKDGKTDLVSVAVGSGKTEQLSSFDQSRIILQHSADDATFYFFSGNNDGLSSILQWDMAARKETALATSSSVYDELTPSPDGKWLVRTRPSELSVRPLSGGDWKSLVSETNGLRWQNVVSPDSKWVIYHEFDQTGKDYLSRVSIFGGRPERLGDFPSSYWSGYLTMSPDGHQILATCVGDSAENSAGPLWVLDNYVPSPKK